LEKGAARTRRKAFARRKTHVAREEGSWEGGRVNGEKELGYRRGGRSKQNNDFISV